MHTFLLRHLEQPNNICNESVDPIIIGFAVIIVYDDSLASETCNLILQLLDKHWI